MPCTPIRDRVLIRRSSADATTPGGLHIPDTARDKPSEGVVLAVGGGAVTLDGSVCPPVVKVGDRVLFAKGAGIEAKVDGDDAVILREAEILCVLS